MRIRIICSTIALMLSFVAHCQPDTVRWTAIMGGTKAGFLKKWKTPDGLSHEWFQYNDRGRGDSTVSHYRENEHGLIVWLEAAGKDYFKKPVFEKYALNAGIATWENNSEKGFTTATESASYLPLKISCGTSYKYYFSNRDSTVALLPAGKQRLSIVTSHKLPDGQKLFLCQTSGAGLTPSYTWMDSQHENAGFVSEWFSLVREGLEGYVDELIKIQKPFERRHFNDLRKRLAVSRERIAVTNANVFDPIGKKVLAGRTILIEKGMIREVLEAKPRRLDGYSIVDAKGKFVMPGLWDMHVHYQGGADGLLHIGCGVTNVRDMGNSDALLSVKSEIERGEVIGPRIQMMSGFIDGAGPFAGPIGAKINSLEEGLEAVKKYASLGYQQIKLYSSVKPEWVAPLASEAKKYNLRVSGHIPAHMLATEAVEAGYDEIQHMNMIFLNFYGKELDTRTPVRFTTVAQKAAFFDFESEPYKEFLKQLKTKGIAVDPTVSIFESMFTHREGRPSNSMAAVIDRLPLTLQRSLKSGGGLGVPNGLEETYENSYRNMLRMVKALYDAGITIVPGTDDFAGFVLHRELENYVKAGIPTADVLAIATNGSATVANQSQRFGSISPGKVADIIIVDGNPLENISDIRKVRTVIQNESIYESAALFEAISIAPGE